MAKDTNFKFGTSAPRESPDMTVTGCSKLKDKCEWVYFIVTDKTIYYYNRTITIEQKMQETKWTCQQPLELPYKPNHYTQSEKLNTPTISVVEQLQ